MLKIRLGVYRLEDDMATGDVELGWELHRRRASALHDILDNDPVITVENWGDTDDTDRTHEYVALEVALYATAAVTGKAALDHLVLPALKMLAENLMEKMVEYSADQLIGFVQKIVGPLWQKTNSEELKETRIELEDRVTVLISGKDTQVTVVIDGRTIDIADRPEE
ncbi:hypothetical protein [Ruegeria sp. EL01]|jgi:hypothetical protein|uniref:hypothetical protein n=1 Tax=Ruegeria sp. EL01 TaxID=2107578 RepID=UPI000EA81CDD|nr:hypothetical protein [Ruegeria sp. EL01]